MYSSGVSVVVVNVDEAIKFDIILPCGISKVSLKTCLRSITYATTHRKDNINESQRGKNWRVIANSNPKLPEVSLGSNLKTKINMSLTSPLNFI